MTELTSATHEALATRSRGLYNPEEFRDNCGFGMIAHVRGEPSHRLLATAIESLTCMTHRGGIAADGKTGDGCGLLMQMPYSFMRQVGALVIGRPLAEQFAVGMLFLSQESEAQTLARNVISGTACLDNKIRIDAE